MTPRYCPLCGTLTRQIRGSRFVVCDEHGKIRVTVSKAVEQ